MHMKEANMCDLRFSMRCC